MKDATPHQDLFADAQAQQHQQVDQRQNLVEDLPRTRFVAGLKRIPDLHVDIDNLGGGHEPAGAAPQLREHPAPERPAEDAVATVAGGPYHRAQVVGAWAGLLFDIANLLDLAQQANQKVGRKTRRRVLHDDRQIGGLPDRAIVVQDLIRRTRRDIRRQRHDRLRLRPPGVARVLSRDRGAGSGHTDDHRHLAACFAHNNLDQLLALAVGEVLQLAAQGWIDQAVGARFDTEAHLPTQALDIQVAIRVQRGLQDREDPAHWLIHRTPSLRRRRSHARLVEGGLRQLLLDLVDRSAVDEVGQRDAHWNRGHAWRGGWLATQDRGVERLPRWNAQQRPGVDRAILEEQQAARPARGVGRGAVQGADVMDRDSAGAQLDRHRLIGFERRIGDRTDKRAVLVMVEHRAAMRAGDREQTAVFEQHIVDRHADRQQVVVRVRVERPVLVPFDRAAELWRFHVELVAVGPDGWANQLSDDVEDALMAHDPIVDWMVGGRALDAPHPRRRRSVARLKVEYRCWRAELARLLYKLVGGAAKLGDLLGREDIVDADVPVGVIKVDLVLRELIGQLSGLCELTLD